MRRQWVRIYRARSAGDTGAARAPQCRSNGSCNAKRWEPGACGRWEAMGGRAQCVAVSCVRVRGDTQNSVKRYRKTKSNLYVQVRADRDAIICISSRPSTPEAVAERVTASLT